ncbi:ICMT-domain-containing protein [Amylostereum chailletii]|nr:ICMT-domain-containing protein [Amylostereum chailletii]
MIHPASKLLCLAASAASYYFSFTPPLPAPTTRDEVYKGPFFETIVRRLTYMSKIFACTMLACEFLVVAAVAYPTTFHRTETLRTLCYRAVPNSTMLLTPTPTFLLGFALMASTAFLRLWCFKTLGNLFTFEVTVRPSHVLVTTGPYAYVRHPSYTAASLHLVGWFTIHFASGGWNRECELMWTQGGKWVALYFGLSLFSIISMWKRGPVEDEGLRKKFGDSWERYRKEVPSMFIPGIW